MMELPLLETLIFWQKTRWFVFFATYRPSPKTLNYLWYRTQNKPDKGKNPEFLKIMALNESSGFLEKP